jgi:hypothetical protein
MALLMISFSRVARVSWVGACLTAVKTGLGKGLSMWLSADMVGGATSVAEVVGCLVEEERGEEV